MSDLVTVGETMALLSSPHFGRLRHAPHLDLGVAGAESNVAIGFHRLGGSATWVGRVGDDELGALVHSTIRGTGVDTVAVVDPERPTGLMLKERSSSSARRVSYFREDSAGSRLRPDDVDEQLVAEAGIVHLTGITAAIGPTARETVTAVMQTARTHGTTISFDLNYRSALWRSDEAGQVLRELVTQADVVFSTFEEALLIVDAATPEQAAAAIAELGPREVAVKLGADGSVAWSQGEVSRTAAASVTVVDSVGAGDAYAAGYLFELSRGNGLAARVATANRTGAYAVTVDGDWEGAPTYAELGDLDGGHDAVRR